VKRLALIKRFRLRPEPKGRHAERNNRQQRSQSQPTRFGQGPIMFDLPDQTTTDSLSVIPLEKRRLGKRRAIPVRGLPGVRRERPGSLMFAHSGLLGMGPVKGADLQDD
jgi:hypothetical protein